MRLLLKSTLLLSLFLLSTTTHTMPMGSSEDIKEIKRLIQQHATSGQNDDVAGMVATQHENADERLADGTLLEGREAIKKFYESIVASGPGRLAHKHPDETIRIRFLRPDVAFVDVDTVSMTGEGPHKPFFLVFTKVTDKWAVSVIRSGVPVNNQ